MTNLTTVAAQTSPQKALSAALDIINSFVIDAKACEVATVSLGTFDDIRIMQLVLDGMLTSPIKQDDTRATIRRLIKEVRAMGAGCLLPAEKHHQMACIKLIISRLFRHRHDVIPSHPGTTAPIFKGPAIDAPIASWPDGGKPMTIMYAIFYRDVPCGGGIAHSKKAAWESFFINCGKKQEKIDEVIKWHEKQGYSCEKVSVKRALT